MRGRAFSLYTSHGLRLAMLGSVPIGAWVPFPGSTVDLASQRSEFFAENTNSRIVEDYPGDIGLHWVRQRKDYFPSQPQYFPLGDFLGPNLVAWSESPGTRIIGTSFEDPAPSGVVTALLIGDTNFSTRIAVAPVSLGSIHEMTRFAQRYPRSAREDLYAQDVPAGKVSVTVEKPLSEDQYEKLKRRVRAQPVTWVPIKYPPEVRRLKPGKFGLPRNVEVVGGVQRGGVQQQRYPPLPRYSGLNVFGPLRQISFRGVRGNLTIADETRPLSGSADVLLGDVKGLRDESGHQLISAPLATAGKSAELQFRAVGTASVNGVSQTTLSTHLEPRLAIVGTVLTLIGGILGIVASLYRLRQKREDAQPQREADART